MTAAQKKARDNFKKAIAYRKKTGCSLKEAFAHVKGGKIKGLDKVVKKGNKTAVIYSKKAAPKKKKEPKKKVVKQGKLFGVTIFEYKVSQGGKYYVASNLPLKGIGIIQLGNGKDHKRNLFTYTFTETALKKMQKLLGKENTTYIESDY
jgi:hypothetical protein